MLPDSAKQKLDRADRHINDLKRLIGHFLDQRPFKLVRRFNPEASELTLSVATAIPIPDEIPLTLGDALHNLRGVLDHTYFAIISRHTDNRGNIQFPIYRPDNKKSVLGRRLVQLAPKQVRIAIEECQPQPDGKYGIFELDAADVEDKHRILLVTGRSADIPAKLVNLILPEAGTIIEGEGVIRFYGKGDKIICVPLSPLHPTARRGAFEDEVQVATNFGLLFGPGTPFEGVEIIPKLVSLRDNVAEASDKVWDAAKT